MIIDDEEKRYVVSSGNVFADVGLPDAEECFVRSRLLIYLVKEIKKRNLSIIKQRLCWVLQRLISLFFWIAA